MQFNIRISDAEPHTVPMGRYSILYSMKITRRLQVVPLVALPFFLFGVLYHIRWGLLPSGNSRLLQRTLSQVDKVEFFHPCRKGGPYLTLTRKNARNFIGMLRASGSDGGSKTIVPGLQTIATMKFYKGSNFLTDMKLEAQFWAPFYGWDTDAPYSALQRYNYSLVWRGRTFDLRRGSWEDIEKRHIPRPPAWCP